jgi:hypothetical protein
MRRGYLVVAGVTLLSTFPWCGQMEHIATLGGALIHSGQCPTLRH